MSSERLLPHAALSAHAHNRIGLRRTDDQQGCNQQLTDHFAPFAQRKPRLAVVLFASSEESMATRISTA